MARDNINDILVFLAVARERSFTRAAGKLGMTQSALSHIIRGLEARMGVRLLTRTTRSVSPTEAGERLLQNVAPRLEEIEAEIAAVSELGDKPAGTVRITATDHVINNVLWPRLSPVLLAYPDIHVELSADYRMVDIAAERFDIGVRWGDQVEKDMIAVRITPDTRVLIVGAPGYFAHRPVPTSAKDLQKHNCIGLRLATVGGVYAWELRHDGANIDMRPRGQIVCSGVYQMLGAALSGNGLAFLSEDLVAQHVRAGRLVSVMEDWCPHFPGLHAYYPSRRHPSRALALVLDALRHKG
ncbi:DNA-binding transcriptional LysR family regulator [Pseudoduganella flava]|uniref:DNA-binding transcriptional LysR family regulator n=1 Tax=Pseudoduganella flava TaxID=871742 RepID=A0A562PBL8_9BURK|nr:LysR family transcriptional regulator [Pseudoduganella flava]QGZ37987.1 LysR family transcriptional regulator [Pseudoduganella flava]TWI41808.1 DNA-binding transcriptional LysR family regulator [Pseudoduganella flava]